MKELTILKNPKFCLRKLSRKNKLTRVQQPQINYGRWTIEENKLFEEKYIEYLQKKITLRELKRSIPTRTIPQIHSHMFKKKYELDKKFCAIANKEIQEEIKSIKKFFEKERSEKPAKETQLIFLRDEIKKKIFGISLENFILMKKFFPNKGELKFDFQAIHNFLLARKAEKEYDQMLQNHEKEKNRTESLFENNGIWKANSSNNSSSIPLAKNDYSDIPIRCEPYYNVESAIPSKKEKILDLDFKHENSIYLTTAENTPIIDKLLYSSSNELRRNSTNFISDFDKDKNISNGGMTNIFSNFVATNKKNLDFYKDETCDNSQNYKNTIRSCYFSIHNKSNNNKFSRIKNLNHYSNESFKNCPQKVKKNEVFRNQNIIFKKRDVKKKDEKSSYESISECEDLDFYMQNNFPDYFINEINTHINSDSTFSNLNSGKKIKEQFNNLPFFKNKEFKCNLLNSKKFNQEYKFDSSKSEEEIGSKETSLQINNSLSEKNTYIYHNSFQNINFINNHYNFKSENSYYGNASFYDYDGHSYFNNVIEKELYDEDFGFKFQNTHSSLY